MLVFLSFRFGTVHRNHRNTNLSIFLTALKRDRQTMPPCLRMLCHKSYKSLASNEKCELQKVWKFFGYDPVLISLGKLFLILLPTSFYCAACRWENGATVSSGGILDNPGNESTRHHSCYHFICSSSCTQQKECCYKRSE